MSTETLTETKPDSLESLDIEHPFLVALWKEIYPLVRDGKALNANQIAVKFHGTSLLNLQVVQVVSALVNHATTPLSARLQAIIDRCAESRDEASSSTEELIAEIRRIASERG